MESTILFYVLAITILVFSAAVIVLPNPIYAALSLAVTMISLGFVYFLLDAYFIAGVQLIVYAGAVMVLFVMVLMLFDLKKDDDSYSGGALSVFLKLFCGLILTAAVALAVRESIEPLAGKKAIPNSVEQIAVIKALANQLFTRYVFAFEALGILLLIVAVGVVAVSRSKGGTHARD